MDTGSAEVDILGVVLARDCRRQQLHDVHPRQAPVGRQLPYLGAVLLLRWQLARQLGDDVPQPVDLLLPQTCEVARLAYCRSFWRLSTPAMSAGSGP